MKKILVTFVLVSLVGVIGCARFEESIRTEVLPEDELYQLAMQKFNNEEWDPAIAAFDRFERLYINSPNIQRVRLLRADAHFNKDKTSGYLTAKAEYQQFIALYPNFENEDYIWFQIANCSLAQMLPSNRDQTYTKAAIADLELFLSRFSDSEYAPQAREALNTAYKRLADYHILVGDHYYNRGIFISAAQRYKLAIEQNVGLDSLEDVLYKLVSTMAKSAVASYLNYETLRDEEGTRARLARLFKQRYERAMFDVQKYYDEYRSTYPNNSVRLGELDSLVNSIPEITGNDTASDQ